MPLEVKKIIIKNKIFLDNNFFLLIFKFNIIVQHSFLFLFFFTLPFFLGIFLSRLIILFCLF